MKENVAQVYRQFSKGGGQIYPVFL